MLRIRACIVIDIAEVVVDDIENHAQSDAMCPVDKTAKIVRLAIESRRREHRYAIVPPPESTRKIGYWHHLDHRNSDPCQFVQFPRGGGKRPLRCERANVHLINYLAQWAQTFPTAIGPVKTSRIDNLR